MQHLEIDNRYVFTNLNPLLTPFLFSTMIYEVEITSLSNVRIALKRSQLLSKSLYQLILPPALTLLSHKIQMMLRL